LKIKLDKINNIIRHVKTHGSFPKNMLLSALAKKKMDLTDFGREVFQYFLRGDLNWDDLDHLERGKPPDMKGADLIPWNWMKRKLDTVDFDGSRIPVSIWRKRIHVKESKAARILRMIEDAATVSKGEYVLYHSTPAKNVPQIQSSGLSKSMSQDPYAKEQLFWLSDDFDKAYQHAVSRMKVRKETGEILTVKFRVPVPEIGLHKAIYKGVYTVHGAIPAKYIDSILDKNKKVVK